MDLAAQTSEVGEQAQRLLHGARDVALEKVVPSSIDRVRELAERLPKHRYLDEVQALERDFAARVKRLEGKLEQRGKRLGIDTPWDRRRRARRRRATGAVVLVGLGGSTAYAVWRTKQSMSPPEQPPEQRDQHAAGPGAPASDGHSRDDRRPAFSSR